MAADDAEAADTPENGVGEEAKVVGEEESGETEAGDDGRENWKTGEEEREEEEEFGAEGGGIRKLLRVSRIRKEDDESLLSREDTKTSMSQRQRASRITRSTSTVSLELEEPVSDREPMLWYDPGKEEEKEEAEAAEAAMIGMPFACWKSASSNISASKVLGCPWTSETIFQATEGGRSLAGLSCAEESELESTDGDIVEGALNGNSGEEDSDRFDEDGVGGGGEDTWKGGGPQYRSEKHETGTIDRAMVSSNTCLLAKRNRALGTKGCAVSSCPSA